MTDGPSSEGRMGGVKRSTLCTTTFIITSDIVHHAGIYSRYEILLAVTRCSMETWKNCRSQLRVHAASDFGLKWPPKTRHLLAPSVIATNKWLSASALGRCPPMAGNLTLKCVGTLTTWPYTAGGRSRRGLPKAGTTVVLNHHAFPKKMV